jgi:hypothetical protein
LILATVATLFFVPVAYSVLRRKPPADARNAAFDYAGFEE